MTRTDPLAPAEVTPTKSGHWVVFGIANLVIVTILALTSWYLLVDPEWSPLSSYPEPYTALLFWAIIALVGLGFNQEFSAFSRFRQPAKGFVIVAAAAIFRHRDDLRPGEPVGRRRSVFLRRPRGGLGYFTGALWVLFAFVVYAMSVFNWEHWPSSLTGLTQPWLGAAQIVVLIVPTTALYLIFGLPSLATWAQPGGSSIRN